MTSLKDLFTPLSPDDLQGSGFAIFSTLGFRVNNWKRGGIARTLLGLFANLLAPITTKQVTVNQSGFLDYAVGDTALTDPATPALQLKAKQDFNVDVILATFAPGEVTLNNSAGGVYSFDAFECVFSRSDTGKTYSNTAAFTVGSMQTGVVVPIQAVEVGSASSADIGQVDTIVTSMPGVSCSNAATLVGTDTETNASLISRCRSKGEAISAMGPRGIYDFVARTPTFNGGANVNRTNVDGARIDGTLTVYLASPSGIVEGPDVAKVQAGFDQWASPWGITPTAVSATAVVVPVTWTAYVTKASKVTQEELEAAADKALDAYFANAPLGGWVISGVGKIFQNAIESAIKTSVAPGAVAQVIVNLPTGDVTIGKHQVAVYGTPTPTVIFI